MDNNENLNNTLGTESIGKLLFKMATPAITAQIVNMLYNIVDRIFISKIPEIGTIALTGVGVTFPISILISAFALLIGMGGSPRAAIRMGQNNYDEAEEILGNSFISLIIISLILTVFFLIFNEKLLLMFGASNETLPYAEEYIRIYVFGTIFVQFALGLNMFISCQGFAKVSMQTILIGAALNIIFDFIFIKIFNMGVKGASFATIISQAVSALWVLRFLIYSKQTKIRINPKYFKIKKSILFPILALGISPFIMQSTESLLNIAFNSSLKNYGGDRAVGAMTILSTIMQCVSLTAMGISQGAQPIISFNYGLGNKNRVQKTLKLLITVSTIFTIFVWIFIMVSPEIFIMLFIENGDPMMEYTKNALRTYMFAIFIMGVQFSCQQSFVALGQARVSLILALLRKIILLIPIIYIFPFILPDRFLTSTQEILFNTSIENKVFAVLLAEPFADFLAAISTIVLFIITTKKLYVNMDKNDKL